MQIAEVIKKMKAYHKFDPEIDPKTTRDQVLYGDPNQECTGITTTQWPSIDVIKQTAALGANLIITHEALFWNHGDHTDWLEETQNSTYLAKKALLDDNHITVWRDHDHVHAGIPMPNGEYVDGIFYGLLEALDWTQYRIPNNNTLMSVQLPNTTVTAVAQHLVSKLGLRGARIIGNPNNEASSVTATFHILGDAKAEITEADQANISVYIAPELIDFTLSEYIRDSSQLGQNKSIVTVGHFNLEEPGMAYMVNYIPKALGIDLPVHFIKSGDMYHYVSVS